MFDEYRGKRVLITANTGFKRSWLALWLRQKGAVISGIALPPEPDRPSLFEQAHVHEKISLTFADIREFKAAERCLADFRPKILVDQSLNRANVEQIENDVVRLNPAFRGRGIYTFLTFGGTINTGSQACIARQEDFPITFNDVNRSKNFDETIWRWALSGFLGVAAPNAWGLYRFLPSAKIQGHLLEAMRQADEVVELAAVRPAMFIILLKSRY
jgi:hypothetical protein